MPARFELPLLIAALAVAVGCGRPGSGPTEEYGPAAPRPTETAETGPGTALPGSEVPPAPDSGRDLYAANCLRCHGDQGLGDGPKAASLYERPANLQKHVPHHGDAELSKVIRSGPGPMPAFEDLSEDDMKALLTYLRTLAPEH